MNKVICRRDNRNDGLLWNISRSISLLKVFTKLFMFCFLTGAVHIVLVCVFHPYIIIMTLILVETSEFYYNQMKTFILLFKNWFPKWYL